MRFASRRYSSPDAFVRDFLDSLTIHLTPRTDWQAIERDLDRYADTLLYFQQTDSTMIHGLIYHAPDPLLAVQAGFRLLGYSHIGWQAHHDDEFMMWAEDLIAARDTALLHQVCDVLKEQGLSRILENGNLDAILQGHLLRHYRTLEPQNHAPFYQSVDELVMSICEQTSLTCRKNDAIQVSDLRHTMDYMLYRRGQPEIALQVIYYEVAGSFPFELQDGGHMVLALQNKEITPVCILDGKGFYRMQNALKKACLLLPDIYTLQQAIDHLEDDIV